MPARQWLNKLAPKGDEAAGEVERQQEETNPDDILNQLGISLETVPPEDIKTSSQMGKVRFRRSSPHGYLYDDVDSAFERAIESMLWYEKTLHQRDLDVHKLATQLDHAHTDYQNLQFQLETYRARGKVLVDDDGKPLVIKGEARIEDVDALRSELAELQGKYDRQIMHQQTLDAWILEAQQHIARLEADQGTTETADSSSAQAAQTAIGDLEDLRTQIAQLAEQNRELQERNQEMEAWIEQAAPYVERYSEVEAENEQLRAALSAGSAALADDSGLSNEERQQFNALIEWSETVQVEYASMESQLAELSSKAQQADELAAEKESLQEQVRQNAEEAQSLSQEMETLRTALAESQAAVSTLQAQLEGERDQAESVATELERVRSELAQAQESSAQLAQNTQFGEELEQLRAEMTQKDEYIEQLTAWAAQVEASMQAAFAEPEQEVVETEEDELPDLGTVDSYIPPTTLLPQGNYRPSTSAEPYGIEEEDFVVEPQPQVAQPELEAEADVEEEEEDEFARTLRELNSPEVPGTPRRLPPRGSSGYAPARPGAPLSSLPPGTSLEDFL